MKSLKDQEVWLSDVAFAICPKIFNQLWGIHGKVEERVNQEEELYLCLVIVKKEIQKIVLEVQEIKPNSAGRPLKDPIGLRT
ncbi:hypothetical protein DSO57_1022399 [Entomophthora muscae]|uniref:Uncharacterized protein n=1 Tax=Entomophthora muscae TaxID=34485 RepID=A0ACC2RHT9_9FUNG|nr:hypothetical protein DSO57_1022399 [Entomophthora muscae]